MKEKSAEKGFMPPVWIGIVVVVFLFAALTIQVIQLGSPDIHTTLLFTTVLAIILVLIKGCKWEVIEEGIHHGMHIATIALLILMSIGFLIPAWIGAGTIPSLIYYGLKIISPSVFLPTVMIVCFLSAMSIGSSWSTAATFGVAFMGISAGLGIPGAVTAGAVITGAVLGDKMSPVSDTPNLSAGVCEANLFDTIKSCMYTAIPVSIIALALFAFLGMKHTGGKIDASVTQAITDGIAANFNVTAGYALISLIPVVVIVVMAAKKISGLACMITAALIGMLIAIIVQGHSLYEMMSFMNYGYVLDSGNAAVDKLFNRGGLQGMMWTISLGYIALTFGGILEKTNILEALLSSLSVITKNARNLIIAHIFAGILTNLLTASNYLGIIIPGRMFIPGYKKLGIKTSVAARNCQDSSCVVSALVPWGLCGVFYTGALGVSTFEYWPYCFLAYLSPIVAIIYAITGFGVFKEEKKAEIE